MRGTSADRLERTESGRLPADSHWAFERGDLLSPGRRVIRRLGDGGAHEVYLVDVGGS